MPRVRAWAAIAAQLAAALVLSACATDAPIAVPPPVAAVARPPPRPEPVSPRQVRTEVYRWFVEAGYPAFQAAALMEHARYESGYRPCAAGPAGLRYLFQWGGGRLQRLHAFAKTYRCPPLHIQLQFADYELRNDPKYSCFLHTATKPAALAALRRGFGRGSC
jgi:hypothetical protein